MGLIVGVITMSNLLRAAAIGVAVSVTACAIHPLPDDVTGVSTITIVKKIRCEARDALKENLVRWLTNPRAHSNPLAAKDIGEALQNGSLPVQAFYSKAVISRLSASEQRNVQIFQGTAIAYDFTFDMTEMNNLDPTVNLIRPLRDQTFSAAIGANFDRTRENTRTFTISDTFNGLFTKIPKNYCDNITEGKNYIYPVTGTIGIDEMIRTFVALTLFGDLSGSSTGDDATASNSSAADDAKAASPPPTMGDTLRFTTTLTLSPSPVITLTPIGTALQISSANLIAKASRMDMHEVIVALALPPPSSAGSRSSSISNSSTGCNNATGSAGQAGARALSSSSTPAPLLVNTNACATPAERIATHTIEQIITRFEVGRAVVATTTD
jgi:hypothetical protein